MRRVTPPCEEGGPSKGRQRLGSTWVLDIIIQVLHAWLSLIIADTQLQTMTMNYDDT